MPVTFIVKRIATNQIIRYGSAPTVEMAEANIFDPGEEELIITFIPDPEVPADPPPPPNPENETVDSEGNIIPRTTSGITFSIFNDDPDWLANATHQIVFSDIPFYLDANYNAVAVIEPIDNICVAPIQEIFIDDEIFTVTTDTPGFYKITIRSWNYDNINDIFITALDFVITQEAIESIGGGIG